MLSEREVLERQLENAKKRVDRLDTSPGNQKAILDFADFCFAEGLSVRRVIKYITTLCTLSKRLSKEFHDITRADIQDLVRGIERSDYSDWTKRDFRIALKKFYRWLRGTEDYPPEVSWLRAGSRIVHRKLPEELLTQKEVQEMIVAALNAREKALIAILYESGCRTGEILSLRIQQIQQHPHGFQITVEGQKRPRRLLLIACAPYLTSWLNQHPMRDNPQAPLWITSDYHARRLSYSRISYILRTVAKRAGISKPVNPYNFRHSRATHLANKLTEAQMKEYFGWVQGSDMASTYVHLSGRDIDNALLKLNNIPTNDEDNAKNEFSLRHCLRCEFKNPPGHKFCSRCGAALDEKTAHKIIQRELERNRADDIMERLIQNQEFRDMLDRKIKELSNAGN